MYQAVERGKHLIGNWVTKALTATAEDDGDDEEPTPSEQKPGDDIGDPMNAEQRSAGGDSDGDQCWSLEP